MCLLFITFNSNIALLYPIAGLMQLASAMGYLFLVPLNYKAIGQDSKENGNEQIGLLESDSEEMEDEEEENIQQG